MAFLSHNDAKGQPRWLTGESAAQWANMIVLLVGIGSVSWLTMARVVRGQVMSLRDQPFVEAARALGFGRRRIIGRHILPNLIGTIVVYGTLTVPAAILSESFLSFLGLGIQAPLPSWGNLASEGTEALNPVHVRWWLITWPCRGAEPHAFVFELCRRRHSRCFGSERVIAPGLPGVGRGATSDLRIAHSTPGKPGAIEESAIAKFASGRIKIRVQEATPTGRRSYDAGRIVARQKRECVWKIDSAFRKDFIFATLFVVMIGAVIFVGWQFNYQEGRLTEVMTRTQLLDNLRADVQRLDRTQTQQLAVLEEINKSLKSGAVTVGNATHPETVPATASGRVRQKNPDGSQYVYYPDIPESPRDPSKLADYSFGDWIVKNLGQEPSSLQPYVTQDMAGQIAETPGRRIAGVTGSGNGGMEAISRR